MELTIQAPSEKQKQFLMAKCRHIAFGGARGGGKSWAVRTKAKLLALHYPGIKILILRKRYRELLNNHVRFLMAELHGIANYNKADKEFLFPNGSLISFGYCAADRDLDQYQGAEFDVLFLDEATQLKEDWIKKLTACVRGVNGFPKRIYYTCNPGGPGHGYIKRLFLERRFEPGEKPEDYRFIQSLITDNHALMAAQPEYIQQLKALPPKLQKAWLEGRWDVFEGQFFEDFRLTPDVSREPDMTEEELQKQRRWCHVIKPFPIPDSWRIYRSYDWGYGKPFSVGWWAVDHDGVLYRILELYGCTETPNEGVKWDVPTQMRQIAKIEAEHPWLRGKQILGVADPSIFDGSRGESIADTALRFGVCFSPGVNDRIPGWMQVHYRLSFDEAGYPGMYVFEGCKAFIRTIPTLQYDPRRPEDLDTEGEDHVADEVRYLCMARPVRPAVKQKRRQLLFDPLEIKN